MGQVAQGRRSRIYAGLAVTILAGAFGVAGAIGLRSRRAAPLPMAAERLPRPTRFVARTDVVGAIADRHRMREADVPDRALWTALAERACGGDDLFRLLVEAQGDPRRAALALAKPPQALARAIACGRALADRGGPHRGLYRLSFEDDERPIEVELLADGAGELPQTVPHFRDTPAPGNLVAARCLVRSSRDRDDPCDDEAPAVGRLAEDDAWAIGDLDALRAFGRAYALDHDRDEETLEAFEDLADEMAAQPRSVAGLAPGFTNQLTVVLDVSVSMHGEPETRALLTAVREGSLAWGMQRPAPDTPGLVRIVVLAHGKTEAATIASAWSAYLERLVRELDAQETPPPAEDDVTRAAEHTRARIARRAVDEAKVVVDNHRVELQTQLRIGDTDRAALAALHDRTAGRAALAAEVIRSVVDRAAPPDALLAELGGEPFARAVEVERAVAAGQWPFEPEAWPEVTGFFVPGRGRYATEYLDTSEVSVYSYPMRRSVLRRVFADVARAKGWQVRRGATSNLYELRRGELRVRVLLGGRSPSPTRPSRTDATSSPVVDGPTSSLVLFAKP